jgi:hypothetical protein
MEVQAAEAVGLVVGGSMYPASYRECASQSVEVPVAEAVDLVAGGKFLFKLI